MINPSTNRYLLYKNSLFCSLFNLYYREVSIALRDYSQRGHKGQLILFKPNCLSLFCQSGRDETKRNINGLEPRAGLRLKHYTEIGEIGSIPDLNYKGLILNSRIDTGIQNV